jgi:NTP pyrophosphatase (non-canonical NTP hydrolase)
MDRKRSHERMWDRWTHQAARNVEHWGVQEMETLLLAVMEELGELAQAYLEWRAEDGRRDRVDEELDDLGALLVQIHWRWKGHPEWLLEGVEHGE